MRRLALLPLLLAALASSAQDRDPDVLRKALDDACACATEVREDETLETSQGLEHCMTKTVIRHLKAFNRYFGIRPEDWNRPGLPDSVGREFGMLLVEHCPELTRVAMRDPDPGSDRLHMSTKMKNLGGDVEGLFLGDGSLWTLDGVEGVDTLLAALCTCMETGAASGEGWTQGIERCMTDVLPDHARVWMACLDPSVFHDQAALEEATHDLGVALGMRLLDTCEGLSETAPPPWAEEEP